MSLNHLEHIEINLQRARAVFKWLSEWNPPHDRVANFGCNHGEETFRLMWSLDSSEAIGIDIKKDNIDKAAYKLEDYRQAVTEVLKDYPHWKTNSTEREKWDNEIPNCIKNSRFPKFIIGDMTKKIELPSNHFDLAYCDKVIYNIDENKWISAVLEMKRVVRPGGWVVAGEPFKLLNGRILDLVNLFRMAKLQIQGTYPEQLAEDINWLACLGVKPAEIIQ